MAEIENVIVIVGDTRLDGLKRRFNTASQAKFYIEQSGGYFKDYEAEHETMQASIDSVVHCIQRHVKFKVVERKYLPNFIFSEKDAIVVVGQDGLVANTAKYAKGLPLMGVNPDVSRHDGVLLPFTPATVEKALLKVIANRASVRKVTLAQASTNDGQRLLAFNDLFIGPSSHISARYNIGYRGHHEDQSSSGIIVSTGAGATGWLSSVMNMTNGVQAAFNTPSQHVSLTMDWEANRLAFVVREPFRSRHSQATVAGGLLLQDEKLFIVSQMPAQGVIFSDGMEADFIAFNSGTTVEIGVAPEKAHLVLNS